MEQSTWSMQIVCSKQLKQHSKKSSATGSLAVTFDRIVLRPNHRSVHMLLTIKQLYKTLLDKDTVLRPSRYFLMLDRSA